MHGYTRAAINWLRLCIAGSLVLLLVVSLAGSMSFLFWQSEMITPFRLQLCLAALAGLILSSLLKRRWLMLVSVIVCIGIMWPVADRLLTQNRLPPDGHGQSVRLVFSNVLCDNRDFSRVTEMVTAQNPDLFVAAETTPEWLDHLRSLHTAYPYRFTPPDLGIFGLAVYTRKPFSARLLRIGQNRMPLARLEFDDYILLVAHPMPPAKKGLTRENQLYMEELARLVETATKPVIIAGDLNNTLWSHNMQPLIRAHMQWPSGSGMAYSWPANRRYMAIQIDHVLARGAKAGQYRVLWPVGSDHLPIRADIEF